jgi:hypothetical protein
VYEGTWSFGGLGWSWGLSDMWNIMSDSNVYVWKKCMITFKTNTVFTVFG